MVLPSTQETMSVFRHLLHEAVSPPVHCSAPSPSRTEHRFPWALVMACVCLSKYPQQFIRAYDYVSACLHCWSSPGGQGPFQFRKHPLLLSTFIKHPLPSRHCSWCQGYNADRFYPPGPQSSRRHRHTSKPCLTCICNSWGLPVPWIHTIRKDSINGSR